MLSFTLYNLDVQVDVINLLSLKSKVQNNGKRCGNNPAKGVWVIYIILFLVCSKVPSKNMTFNKFSVNMILHSRR